MQSGLAPKKTRHTMSKKIKRQAEITRKTALDDRTSIRLDDGETLEVRRFFPAGKGDTLVFTDNETYVRTKKNDELVPVGSTWNYKTELRIKNIRIPVEFKEIETSAELAHFEQLRGFHYRGGGGAGRSLPIIAKSSLWDLPEVLGFVEVSSSMIAQSARKRFFDAPYEVDGEVLWVNWDRVATKEYSNIVCRISRFVIHPEIRGLGLAKLFADAAAKFSAARYHFGGLRPHFVEITADMLRFYPFLKGTDFSFMGETEGNAHRLTKDMTYLVTKALSHGGEKAMPQGGGGIMTLQRGYARQIVKYIEESEKTLEEVINNLRYEPSELDQSAWEALHKLNRRPKPTYILGLRTDAKEYVKKREQSLFKCVENKQRTQPPITDKWTLDSVSIRASASIAQSKEGRILQDTFGFVGSRISTPVLSEISFTINSGEVTLVCGASGSGKTLLLNIIAQLLTDSEWPRTHTSTATEIDGVEFKGSTNHTARLSQLHTDLDLSRTPLDYIGDADLSDFLEITASCGLAEPQLLVRPVGSLSSGQTYRLLVALAFLEKPQVVVIDNFCESLDRYTMIAVCRGVERLARRLSIAVIVASAAYERLARVLVARQTLLLRRGHKPLLKRKRK